MKKTWMSVLAAVGALTFLPATAMSSPIYVVSAGIAGNGIFGTVDTASGAFQQIGPGNPDGYFGLVPASNGKLLSLTYTGNLDSIDPVTGVPTGIGPTGLVGCLDPSACTFSSPFTIGSANGSIYLTDESNRLYTVDPGTGQATLFSANSGLPAFPFLAGTQNADGTFNFVDESIFGVSGNLYVTFDAFVFDFGTGMPVSTPVDPALYRVDLATGKATKVGATDLGIGATWTSNGSAYVFNDATNGIALLDVTTGNTTPVGSFDPSAGVIQGAAAIPEPCTFLLVGAALGGLALLRRRFACE